MSAEPNIRCDENRCTGVAATVPANNGMDSNLEQQLLCAFPKTLQNKELSHGRILAETDIVGGRR